MSLSVFKNILNLYEIEKYVKIKSEITYRCLFFDKFCCISKITEKYLKIIEKYGKCY